MLELCPPLSTLGSAMAQTATPLSPVPDDGPSVIAAAAYAGGRRVANITIGEARIWSRRPGHVVWIGLLEPTESMLRQVQGEFGLHDLAIEMPATRTNVPSSSNMAAPSLSWRARPRWSTGGSPSARPISLSGEATWCRSGTAPRLLTRRARAL